MLAAKGARLALVARRRDRLRELAVEIAANGLPEPVALAADLSQPGTAAEVAERAQGHLGPIDVLVNNAGVGFHGLVWVAGDGQDARRVLETNFWSPLALTAAVAPTMVARGHGAIINTGSMVQVAPFPHLGHYAASRAALALITQTMQLELGPRGVRVVEVALGAVDTAGSTENRTLQGGPQWLDGWPRMAKLERAAEALVKAIEGNAEGVAFHPAGLRLVHALPVLARVFSRRAAKRTDLNDVRIRVGGSSGAPEIQAARERWERDHPRAQ
jgi:short-subunit dehydrogenase